MTTLTIRNLDPTVRERLRLRAAQNDRSMEAEAYAILAEAVKTPMLLPDNLADRIRARVAPFGGVELEIPPRTPMREPPTFE
jgi:antitoxin FitA